MTTLEELGLLKMDFLGLRTLTVIQNAVKLIQKDAGVTLDMQKINYDDKKVLDSLGTGRSDGVFQLESAGMKKLHEGTEASESGRCDRRNFSLPPGPHGFYPPVYPGQKPSGYHPLRLPSAGADPEAYLWVYCLSGTGYADRS